MKKLNFSTILLLLSITTFAAKQVDGYYVTQNNDTMRCKMLIQMDFLQGEPNFERIQWKVKYLDKNGGKQKMYPNTTKAFGFVADGKAYSYHAYKNTIKVFGGLFNDNSYIFLKLKTDGYLKVYEYYQKQNSGGYYNAGTGMMTPSINYTIEKMCFKKGNGELTKIRKLFFKKEMSTYLADDIALAAKISDKVYRADDIDEIVSEYNLHHGAK